jgi:hypothetical protein
MYQAVKLLMFDRRLVLYDYPIPTEAEGGKHSPFIAELLTLHATQRSKNIVIVEAPTAVGAHDDVSDAFVRAAWLSLERLTNTKIAARGYRNETPRQADRPQTMYNYNMSRMRRHGVVLDRRVPRALSRRVM